MRHFWRPAVRRTLDTEHIVQRGIKCRLTIDRGTWEGAGPPVLGMGVKGNCVSEEFFIGSHHNGRGPVQAKLIKTYDCPGLPPHVYLNLALNMQSRW